MDAIAERLTKLREERLAREKARIEKLRQLNLKKYNPEPVKNTPSVVKHFSTNTTKNHASVIPKLQKNTNSTIKNSTKTETGINHHVAKTGAGISHNYAKNETGTNHTTVQSKVNRTKSAPIHKINSIDNKGARKILTVSSDKGLANGPTKLYNNKKTTADQRASSTINNINKRHLPHSTTPRTQKLAPTSRKSIAVTDKQKTKTTTSNTSNVSVFERLYKPKMRHTTQPTDVEKLQTDPDYLKKVINQTGLILNRRHTVFNNNPEKKVPVRRSISAVHLKRVDKSELGNCIHKWSSIGDKLNNIDLKQVNEDETVNDDKVVSAIKSERKRVTFMTPSMNFNTPKQEELQARLKAWLHKRGKALDSYHHLQCFGIYHLPYNLKFDPKLYEDENKENICVESDTDDDSYTENMNDEAGNMNDEAGIKNNKWRTASIVSDSIDLSETQNTTTTCSDSNNTDEVVIGALTDLTELLKEGYEWMQCARWLRAVRERFPSALNCAAYWECRALLEERRGDLPASVKCWEEAIIQGTERSVAEANLDQLLDKFMQLQISPNGEKSRQVDPKFVDVKNVFKSTIIRFAVQQAKLRGSTQEPSGNTPRYSMTPVRRSARLSGVRTPLSGVLTPLRGVPLRLCASVYHAPPDALFVHNPHLPSTP